VSNSEVIRAFILEHFRGIEFSDDEDLFSLGFINSLFALELVEFIEERFDLEIESDDLEIDNFRSVRAMSTLIDLKARSGAAA